jgi:hypothetical protein
MEVVNATMDISRPMVIQMYAGRVIILAYPAQEQQQMIV